MHAQTPSPIATPVNLRNHQIHYAVREVSEKQPAGKVNVRPKKVGIEVNGGDAPGRDDSTSDGQETFSL
jgi:hypothetical protein